jgi:hypothetical protein
MPTEINGTAEIIRILDTQELEITTRRILGKSIQRGVQTLWQADGPNNAIKKPLRLYIVNEGSIPGNPPPFGSPLRDVRLCKRVIPENYPKGLLSGTEKLRVVHRFSFILLLEFENESLKIIHLPKSLSAADGFRSGITIAMADTSVISGASRKTDSDALSLVKGEQEFIAFEYMKSLSPSDFTPALELAGFHHPSLLSRVTLEDLQCHMAVQGVYKMPIIGENSIWTSIVDITLSESIITRLGIDQDIIIQGYPRHTV